MRGRMIRLLAVLSVVALLVLGRGYSPEFLEPNTGVVTAVSAEAVTSGSAQHDEDGCPITEGHCVLCPCGHSAYSPASALIPGDILIRSGDRSADWMHHNDRSIRSRLLKRDPPVPRQLI